MKKSLILKKVLQLIHELINKSNDTTNGLDTQKNTQRCVHILFQVIQIRQKQWYEHENSDRLVDKQQQPYRIGIKWKTGKMKNSPRNTHTHRERGRDELTD